jgi:hypothetical protein
MGTARKHLILGRAALAFVEKEHSEGGAPAVFASELDAARDRCHSRAAAARRSTPRMTDRGGSINHHPLGSR